MIKITNGDLNNPNLNQTLMRLGNQTGFSSPEAAYNFTRLLRQVDLGIKKAREDFNAFADSFYKKDADGKFIPTNGGTLEFEVHEDKKEEFEAQMKLFFNEPVIIESYPIEVSDFGKVDIKPVDFIILEKFMASDESLKQQQISQGSSQEPAHVQ